MAGTAGAVPQGDETGKRKPNAGVMAWFEELEAFAISAITVEEIAFGMARAPADQARRLERWLNQVWLAQPTIVAVDDKIAAAAGRLRAEQAKAGRSASQWDMVIAATALLTARTLVTRNVKHFAHCGVALLNPFSP